jgi:nucleoside 2-deoxyribosyltransferase
VTPDIAPPSPPRRTVFLSGMIDGLPLAEASAWRLRAAATLSEAGFDFYDPTRVMRAGGAAYRATPNEVFTNDSWHLARADLVLVNLDLPPQIDSCDAPFFTIGEMFLAHAAGLPVIAFGKAFRGRPGYEAIVTRSTEDLQEALRYIIEHYGAPAD